MKVKAISLKQPWANLIASGAKTIETRKWPTRYRGPLLICSSKNPPIAPAGMAICAVTVTDCRPMTVADAAAACCEVYDGAWAWDMENLVALGDEFRFSVRGSLGLYDVELPTHHWLERYFAASDKGQEAV
jgi:hypothetical protein